MILRYPSLEAVIETNRRMVALTGEEHALDDSDKASLRAILSAVKRVGESDEMHRLSPKQLMVKKASYLLFSIAEGQKFHEGNKRTALLTTREFLRMNGYTMPLTDATLLKTLDKIAMGVPEATLIETENIIESLVRKK
jgi:prophage maintenance system killer protein